MAASSEGTPTAREIWETLSAVNVNEHTETKSAGGTKLTYLSWAWAWTEMMRCYPQLTVAWNGMADSDGVMRDVTIYPGGTASVSCSVAIGAVTREMWLPVMDHRNKAITNPDSFAINTAKMRCLTKAFALFGLGIYIYAGEDLPTQGEPAEKPTKPPKAIVAERLTEKLSTLETVVMACENHPEIDSKVIQLARDIIKAGGPYDRAAKALEHLTKELDRA